MTDLKTTTAGLLFAIWVVAEPIVKNGEFDFQKDWISLILAVFGGAIGYFAKDKTKDSDDSFYGVVSPRPPRKK